jgi:hypothetical protein
VVADHANAEEPGASSSCRSCWTWKGLTSSSCDASTERSSSVSSCLTDRKAVSAAALSAIWSSRIARWCGLGTCRPAVDQRGCGGVSIAGRAGHVDVRSPNPIQSWGRGSSRLRRHLGDRARSVRRTRRWPREEQVSRYHVGRGVLGIRTSRTRWSVELRRGPRWISLDEAAHRRNRGCPP